MESIDSNYSNASKIEVQPKRQLINEAARDSHPWPLRSPSVGVKSGKIVMASRDHQDWCPQDDGIEVTLPHSEKSPQRQSVNEYIDGVLYGLATKRLPLFPKFRSDN